MARLVEVAVVAADVEVTTRFYESLLGGLPARTGHPEFDLGGLTLRILGPDAAGSGAPGEDHIALAVDDVDAAAAELESHGLRLEWPPRDYYWGRSAYLHDPDGRLVELTNG